MPPASPRVRSLRRRTALLALASAAVAGCGGSDTPAPGAWAVDSAAALGPRRARGDSMRVDVYVDATVSMGGYAAVPESRYDEFLESVESTIQAAWKKADIHYYRFGASAREVDRPTFLTAGAPAFYTEKITGIDRVIGCDSASGVTVVLTDLFQSDGDVNAIVNTIKDRCFQRGRAVAVLGVKSQFAGKVYDARVPPYDLRTGADTSTFRPFYALLFGDAPALEWVLAQFGGQQSGREYVVIAPHVVQRYAVTMRKAPGSQDLNLQNQDKARYQAAFNLLPNKTSGVVMADVAVTPRPGAPPARADRLELEAFRRGPLGAKGPADSTASQDVVLEEAKRGPGDTLHLTLRVTPSGAAGTYAYKLVLRTGGVGGFDLPPWVGDYSSTNPTPTSEPNRTLNLAKFLSDLRRAASSVSQPALAVWYVTVRKP